MKKARLIFGISFLLTSIFLVYFLFSVEKFNEKSLNSDNNKIENTIASTFQNPNNLNNIVIITSTLTVLISFMGFVVSTFLGWRKEKRESESHVLIMAEKELEILRLKKEINSI